MIHPENYTQLESANPHMFFMTSEVVAYLREIGWAVTIMTAEELRGCDPERIQDGMVDDAFERIGCLTEEEAD